MIGYKMNNRPDDSLITHTDMPKSNVQMLGRVEELIRFIEHKYVDSVDTKGLIDEAVYGIFGKLDPHSAYLSPSEVEQLSDEMEGSFTGLGIENAMVDDTLCIYKVLPDSPADKAGILAFDRITTIDARVISGRKMDYDSIRTLMRRPEGTAITVQLLRGGHSMSKVITLASIPVKSVSSFAIPEAKAAVIKIDRFGAHTYNEFMTEIEKYFTRTGGHGGQATARHLIIDLRDNPGGYLPEATNILCQIFEEKDRLLVYTEGKNNKRNDYHTTGKRFFEIDDVIVLIDENSASASEIIAGAIQDWDRGILIGRRSYGKGLVQEQYDLNNGGAIRLTIARYFTPSGRSIQRTYADRGKYDDDYYDRVKNGDLFYADSSTVRDPKQFFTLDLQRKVVSSGGITPDIFVGLDTIYRNEDFMTMRSYLQPVVGRYLLRHRGALTATPAGIQSWVIPAAFYSEMIAYVSKSEERVFFIPASKYKMMDAEVKSMAARLLLSEADYQRYLTSHDPFISRAVSTLKSGVKLASLK
jgi:carboxyl-terminal processing protease